MSDRLTIGQVLQNEPMSLIKPLTAECVLAHGLIRGVYIYIYIYIIYIYIYILPNICQKMVKYVQFVSERIDLTSEMESNCVKSRIGSCWVKQFAAVCTMA